MSAAVGRFPERHSTIKADVLAQLLEGVRLTGMDAVWQINTTRLASQVHVLRSADGWPIESRGRTIDTSDGRSEEISVYSLPADVREAAMASGGTDYCASVKEARAARREAARRHG
jgi:hypothetical protein